MIVVEAAKALALNLANPNRVLETIPSAKVLNFKGKRLVVTPHRQNEVKILRNLGIGAPAPILHYYNWVGRFTPFEHQKMTAAFLTMNQKALVLNEIGTGKTQAALWAADYLMKVGAINKVLIISPLSTLERVWGDGIFMSFSERKHVTLHGAATKRRKLLKTDADFFIINPDGFPIIAEDCAGKFDLVIVDEAATYRNSTTQKYKIFSKWMTQNPKARLWLMTGTPTPNSPTDAWALAKLIGSPFCPNSYGIFRDQVMVKVGKWKLAPRFDSADIVKNILQPAVRYTRDACFDLPDTVFQTRKVALTRAQESHYTKMLRHFITEAAEKGTITAVNEAVKLQKLVQIACGVAYGDDGRNIEIDCSPRVGAVKELIDEVGGKTIIFVPLTGTLRMLERELSKHWSVGVVNGEVPTKHRNAIYHNFQNANEPHVLIAHPATMAHGLTLTAASTVIWYGPITSNEQYVQANGRIERIGKKHVSNVIHIEATGIEHEMYNRLKDKQKLQGVLLDLIQQEMR